MSLPTITYGVGITLTSPDGLSSVFFQPGDDAAQAQEELEALERYFSPDAALRELWGIYEELAQPVELNHHLNRRIAA
jgi:hypothetical protein